MDISPNTGVMDFPHEGVYVFVWRGFFWWYVMSEIGFGSGLL